MKNLNFFIKTFGCQMNVADSERMSVLLQEHGMQPVKHPQQAQIILINGCSVREKAVHKALSALGEFQDWKIKNQASKPILGIGGCVGQLDQAKLFQKVPQLDFVFGTDRIDQLPSFIERVQRGERRVCEVTWQSQKTYSTKTKKIRPQAQSYVNIMKGCDKYCSYCIVPYTRGKEQSRLIDEVLEDVGQLVASGVREVTLLGQNVNSFGKGNPNLQQREPRCLHNEIGPVGPRPGEENFPQLLRALDTDPRCQALKRIRFTSSHPLDFSHELIDCYSSQGGVQRLARHLHLPVQSGSNRILKAMGRHHQIENYRFQMERLKQCAPDVGLSTDLIVGFPGETDEDFQSTLQLLRDLEFDQVYAFAYSVRPGTKAARLTDDVSTALKKQRLQEVFRVQKEIAEKKGARHLGQVREVLVEGPAKTRQMAAHLSDSTTTVWTGKTSCHRVVNFIAEVQPDLTGQFLPIHILQATGFALQGKLV